MQSGKQFFWLVLLTMVSASCAAEKKNQRLVGMGDSFTLAPSDTIQIKDGSTSFWLSLQEIQDSRCPENVNCFTAGRVIVALLIEHQPEIVILCEGIDCSPEQNNFILIEYNRRRYNVVIDKVIPYPQQGKDVETKRATLKIKRATG